MFDNLKGKNIILASKSPRRRELLKELGLDFEIISMAINARKDEIRIMRLVGATKGFIRAPFMVEVALADNLLKKQKRKNNA